MKTIINNKFIFVSFFLLLFVFSETVLASNALDTATNQFKVAADAFGGRVKIYGLSILFALAGIQLTVNGLLMLTKQIEFEQLIGGLVKFILTTGFFTLLIKSSDTYLPMIINSFIYIGQQGSGLSELTPSGIIQQGIDLQDVMVSSFNAATGADEGPLKALQFFVPALELTILCFIVVLSFIVLAGQMVLAMVQGFFWMALTPVLLGFGGISFTRDMAIGSLKGGVTIGMKIMCVYLIAGVAGTLAPIMGEGMSEMKLDDWSPLFWVAAVAFILAYLSFQLPKLAGDLLNGTASLSAGDAGTNMMMAAAAAVATVAGVGAAAATVGKAAMGAAGAGKEAFSGAAGLAQALAGSSSPGSISNAASSSAAAPASPSPSPSPSAPAGGAEASNGAASSNNSNPDAVPDYDRLIQDAHSRDPTGGSNSSQSTASNNVASDGGSEGDSAVSSSSAAAPVSSGAGAGPASSSTAASAGAGAGPTSSSAAASASSGVGAGPAPLSTAASVGAGAGPTSSSAAAPASSGAGAGPAPLSTAASAGAGDASTASIGGSTMEGGSPKSEPSNKPKLHDRIRDAGNQIPQDATTVGLSANISSQLGES